MLELDMVKTIKGHLPEESKEKIRAYLKNPSQEAWNKIFFIGIYHGKDDLNLWEVVCILDPFFPKKANVYFDILQCKKLIEFSKYPSPEVVKKALIFATH